MQKGDTLPSPTHLALFSLSLLLFILFIVTLLSSGDGQVKRLINEQREDISLLKAELTRTASLLKFFVAENRGVKERVKVKNVFQPEIVTVSAKKANLRTGPGEKHSPLMSVTRGTRLVVESSEGEWLRVVSPSGERVWVSSGVVR